MFVLKLVYEALLCNVFICIILLLPDLLFHTPRSPSLTNRCFSEKEVYAFSTLCYFSIKCFPLDTLLSKVRIVKAMVFPVVMYRCERWTIKKAECQRNAAFQTVGEDSWEPLELQGNQPWIFIRRTIAEAEVPTLWPPDVKSWLIR